MFIKGHFVVPGVDTYIKESQTCGIGFVTNIHELYKLSCRQWVKRAVKDIFHCPTSGRKFS